MGLFVKPTKGSIIKSDFVALDAFPQIGVTENSLVTVSLFDEYLELAFILKKSLTLNYNQIIDIAYDFEKNLVEKDKSVIGRAIAGGLLFGGAGAVVGAVSASTPKQKTEISQYLVICYKASNGEQRFLRFKDLTVLKGSKLYKKLKELCNIKDEPEEVSTQL